MILQYKGLFSCIQTIISQQYNWIFIIKLSKYFSLWDLIANNKFKFNQLFNKLIILTTDLATNFNSLTCFYMWQLTWICYSILL